MSQSERFAWQGFSIPLGDDWRPAALTGSFREGYARLDGERDSIVQIRWKASTPVTDLNKRVLAYFSQLEKTAKRSKHELRSELDSISDDAVDYHWHAGAKGYGRMWYDAATKRVMFIERSGRGGDSFKREARELFSLFESHGGERRPWSLVGLSLALPCAYSLVSFKLLSGRTTLIFRRRGAKLTADRWAFASQLLSKHAFDEWAIAFTRIKGEPEIGQDRLRLSRGRKTALVLHDEPHNQILVLNAVHSKIHEPLWDYFD